MEESKTRKITFENFWPLLLTKSNFFHFGCLKLAIFRMRLIGIDHCVYNKKKVSGKLHAWRPWHRPLPLWSELIKFVQKLWGICDFYISKNKIEVHKTFTKILALPFPTKTGLRTQKSQGSPKRFWNILQKVDRIWKNKWSNNTNFSQMYNKLIQNFGLIWNKSFIFT